MPLNGSMVNLMFFILYIDRKWLRKRSHNLPLNSKLSAKFHTFSATGGSTEMLKNGWISNNFNQNYNFKLFYESQTGSCLE